MSFDELWEKHPYRIVGCGMGNDSAMLLAELYDRGYEPDEIIFCDTGAEFPHTYYFVKHVKEWVDNNLWSNLVILKRYRDGVERGIIEECLLKDSLPSKVFGNSQCSDKFKNSILNKYLNNSKRAHNAWGIKYKGEPYINYKNKILKIIGIHYDEQNRVVDDSNDPKYSYAYPLIEWGVSKMGSKVVEKSGLYYPGKSSCIICPNLKNHELAVLKDYPNLIEKMQQVEDNFLFWRDYDGVTSIKGLFRNKTLKERLAEID